MARKSANKLHPVEHAVSDFLLTATFGGPFIVVNLAIQSGHWAFQTWSRVFPGMGKSRGEAQNQNIESDHTTEKIEKLLRSRRNGPKICVR